MVRNPLTSDIQLHSGGFRRFVRLILVTIGILFGGAVVGAVALFILFQGGAIENEALNNRIERAITSFIGPEFDVQLGATKVEFRGASLISITSSDVLITNSGQGETVAKIGKILVGVQPMSLLNGHPKITGIAVESSRLDLSQFQKPGNATIPQNLDVALERLGSSLALLKSRLVSGALQKISIANTSLTGISLGAGSTREINIKQLDMVNNSAEQLEIQLDVESEKSNLNASAIYTSPSGKNASLKIKFDNLSLNEWFGQPDIPSEKFVSTNSNVGGDINFVFNSGSVTRQSVINLVVGSGDLRLGRKGHTRINRMALNFRLFPKLNRIVLERSMLSIGQFQARFVGAVTPASPELGLAGDLDYTLVVERAQGSATQSGEKIFPGSMIVEGGFERERKLLNIDQWKFSVPGGGIVGSASLGFDDVTPSLVFNGYSSGIPMAAIKQFWPIFLATPVRKWVHEHVHGGAITKATIAASIPGGVLGRLHKGKIIADDELLMEVEIANARFDTFGKLPPVRSAKGQVVIRGMETKVSLESGTVYVPNGDPVSLTSGDFTVTNGAILPLIARTTFKAKGPVASLAAISDAKPLVVMDRLKMDPAQWTGRAIIEIGASFPLKKKMQYPEVDWQGEIELINASSTKPITGRKITKADVKISLGNDKAVISGNSTIDGIRGEVLMVEPLGKASQVKRSRTLKARMSEKERLGIGLKMAPVISGPIDVVMEQKEGKKSALIKVNLKNARIELPWIGWRKGQGIPASATFRLTTNNKITLIKNLQLNGQGFHLNGDLVIDKKGVKSADIPNMALNHGDDLSIRIRRANNAYTITANGTRFDSRGLVNKLFHQQGPASDTSEGSFDLSANIARVDGFGNRQATNVILHYTVKDGWLHTLKLNTSFGRAQSTKIDARTKNDNITHFKIQSQNAGSALSFLNLYTHMRDGSMEANLRRSKGNPFRGDVRVKNFLIVDEPKLKKLVSTKQVSEIDRGGRVQRQLRKISTNRVKFISAQAEIEKGEGYLKMEGSLTGVQIGMTYNGTLFDKSNRMDIAGTFMPAFGISRMVSAIPFVGQLLSNGKDSGLIGITYHLSGPVASPDLQLNPLSIVAPGIFKKIFEKKR